MVAPRELGAAPTFPAVASFATAVYGEAFWLVRARDTGPGELFVSSGAQVLRDLRGELGITTGDASTWTAGVLNTLGDRLEAARVSVTLPRVEPGGEITAEWLRPALWFTYSREQGAAMRVELPRAVELPRLGQVLGASSELTHARNAFDPALLARNPWAIQGPGVRLSEGVRARRSNGALWALAGLALYSVGKG